MAEFDFQWKDDRVRLFLGELERFGLEGTIRVMVTLRAYGATHLERLMDALIYGTPPRKYYKRTKKLRGLARVRYRTLVSGRALFVISAAPYSHFVEYGTLEGWTPAEQIYAESVAKAEEGEIDQVVLIEHGRVSEGLEARPIVYPTVAYLTAILPTVVYQELMRTMPEFRR